MIEKVRENSLIDTHRYSSADTPSIADDNFIRQMYRVIWLDDENFLTNKNLRYKAAFYAI